MKYILKLLFNRTALIYLIGCHSTGAIAQHDPDYFAKNVAFMDFRIRQVNENGFVREISLFDFSKTQSLDPGFGYKEDVYFDDGLDFDTKAGDGIYTSKKLHPYTENVKYESVGKTISFLKKIVIDNSFLHEKELDMLIGAPPGANTDFFKIKCKVKSCSCPSECRCLACDWDIITWCYDFFDCEVEVGVPMGN